MSYQQFIKSIMIANVVAFVCGVCFVCSAIGLNFTPNARPSPWLARFLPATEVAPTTMEATAQPAVVPVTPTNASPAAESVPLPTSSPTLPLESQPVPFSHHCEMRRPDGLEHRCYEVTVLPVGDPVAECAAAITTGTGVWAEGSCSTENLVGSCTGGLLILDNPPKTYRFYADNGSYDVASATAFCDTLQGQFTVNRE